MTLNSSSLGPHFLSAKIILTHHHTLLTTNCFNCGEKNQVVLSSPRQFPLFLFVFCLLEPSLGSYKESVAKEKGTEWKGGLYNQAGPPLCWPHCGAGNKQQPGCSTCLWPPSLCLFPSQVSCSWDPAEEAGGLGAGWQTHSELSQNGLVYPSYLLFWYFHSQDWLIWQPGFWFVMMFFGGFVALGGRGRTQNAWGDIQWGVMVSRGAGSLALSNQSAPQSCPLM